MPAKIVIFPTFSSAFAADAPLCGSRSPATLHPNPYPPAAPLC